MVVSPPLRLRARDRDAGRETADAKAARVVAPQAGERAVAAGHRAEPGPEPRGGEPVPGTGPARPPWLAGSRPARRRAARGAALPAAAGGPCRSASEARPGDGSPRAAPAQCDAGAVVGG